MFSGDTSPALPSSCSTRKRFDGAEWNTFCLLSQNSKAWTITKTGNRKPKQQFQPNKLARLQLCWKTPSFIIAGSSTVGDQSTARIGNDPAGSSVQAKRPQPREESMQGQQGIHSWRSANWTPAQALSYKDDLLQKDRAGDPKTKAHLAVHRKKTQKQREQLHSAIPRWLNPSLGDICPPLTQPVECHVYMLHRHCMNNRCTEC